MPLLDSLSRLLRRRAPSAARTAACESCPLYTCRAGEQATVICIDCPALDAERLRSLGLYEGARVGIVDTRSGMVLDVRGARLGLGWKVVAGITVQPLGA
ncbi:MAG TPA: FeoA family protein [Gemmatimonadaceae bacterium]